MVSVARPTIMTNISVYLLRRPNGTAMRVRRIHQIPVPCQQTYCLIAKVKYPLVFALPNSNPVVCFANAFMQSSTVTAVGFWFGRLRHMRIPPLEVKTVSIFQPEPCVTNTSCTSTVNSSTTHAKISGDPKSLCGTRLCQNTIH